jgi:2-succinyl-6-hydroxy-2,4-cyclohexadiene-1-carboxylate synthase
MTRGSAQSVFVDAGGLRLHALLDAPQASDETSDEASRDVPRQASGDSNEGSGATRLPEFLVLHGFTGAAESMERIAADLSSFARVARLELVGHGASDAPDDVALYAMEACAAQILCAARALGLMRPHLLGYSMGGRAALAAALADPGAFASLVLVGATAGVADPALRSERIAADRALADSIERDGLERFVDDWMAQPLFASQARLGREALERARRQRLASRPRGLANSLRGMGAGAQAPLHAQLSRYRGPVLLVVGERDAKFRAIADELVRALPRARIEVVPDAGHAAHLEAPERFAALVKAFTSPKCGGRA